eukprot:242000-Amphidinium_carterae.1
MAHAVTEMIAAVGPSLGGLSTSFSCCLRLISHKQQDGWSGVVDVELIHVVSPRQDCTVKICDFGLARSVASHEDCGVDDSSAWEER